MILIILSIQTMNIISKRQVLKVINVQNRKKNFEKFFIENISV